MSQEKLRFLKLLADIKCVLDILLCWPSGVDEATGLDFATFIGIQLLSTELGVLLIILLPERAALLDLGGVVTWQRTAVDFPNDTILKKN